MERRADRDLFDRLKAGEYCFVFNSWQMGKSSLQVRAMRRLQLEGVACAVIDSQVRGTTLKEDQWYAGTIKRLIKTIATASGDNTVKLWNLGGQELQTLSGHSDWVRSVALIPDGKTIASASRDQTVKLWNLDIDDLTVKGCEWVRDYLMNNPNASDSDRQMCGIPKR